MLCSPEGARSRYLEGFDHGEMVTFEQLVGSMNTHEALRTLQETIGTYWGIREGLSDHFPGYDRWVTVNLLFLEQVKGACLSQTLIQNSIVHTYSYMPYLCEEITGNKTYVYQHGVKNYDQRSWNLYSFTPAKILLWGECWRKIFSRVSHGETEYHVVGNPWFDYLRKVSEESVSTLDDILIVGASHVSERDDHGKSYEEILSAIISACQIIDCSINIKIHHNESISWYKSKNMDQYIKKYEHISDAIKGSKLIVNTTSSSFVEAIALDVPTISDVSWQGYYESMNAENCINFIDFDDLESILPEILKNQEKFLSCQLDYCDILMIGDSVERILNLVSK
jgi:hypothetical protein